jgi:hypothetical protein
VTVERQPKPFDFMGKISQQREQVATLTARVGYFGYYV